MIRYNPYKICYFKKMAKRTIKVLPVIFLSMVAILMICVCCVAAIAENKKIHIGVVIPQESIMERGLIEYIRNMADTDATCEIIELSQDEANEQLEDGKVAAYLTLPENLIKKIYQNEKTAVHMTMPNTPTLETSLLQELMESATSLVLTAKAGDYAAYMLYSEYGKQGSMQKVSTDMNRNYIRFVLRNKTLFRKKTVKNVTGMEDAVRMFFVFFITILFFLGAVMIPFCERPKKELLWLLRSCKIDFFDTAFMDVLLNGSVLFITETSAVIAVAAVLEMHVEPAVILGLAMSSLCVACLTLFFAPYGKGKVGTILSLFLFAAVQFVLLGGIFPIYTLPEAFVRMANVLPGGAMLMMLYGENTGSIFTPSFFVVLLYLLAFFGGAIWRMKRKENRI